MSNIKTISKNMDPNVALEEIEKYTKKAADSLRQCLQSSNLEQYKHFLDTMYHYTSETGNKAKEASENVHTDELKNFFLHFVEEEDWHFKLARDDLRAFGLSVSESKPKEVVEFDKFWASLKGRHTNWYLGALYVFENIVKYVAGDVRDFITRLELTKAQSRWLAIHAEADMEHGAEVAEIVKKYIAENPEAAVQSAREASKLWINIMQSAFSLQKAA